MINLLNKSGVFAVESNASGVDPTVLTKGVFFFSEMSSTSQNMYLKTVSSNETTLGFVAYLILR
jgi:hypothetical protein